jgi:hypothetical protein
MVEASVPSTVPAHTRHHHSRLCAMKTPDPRASELEEPSEKGMESKKEQDEAPKAGLKTLLVRSRFLAACPSPLT